MRSIPVFLLLLAAFVFPAAGIDFHSRFDPEKEQPGDLWFDVGSRRNETGMGFGWSQRERNRERSFRWIREMEADVWFERAETGPAGLWVLAAPFHITQQRQNIGVYLNDQFITEWVCPAAPEYADYHAVLPAAAFQPGRNRLTLRVGYRRRPPGDGREVALAVDLILIRPLGEIPVAAP